MRVERIKLGLTRQMSQWKRAAKQARYLTNDELRRIYNFFHGNQGDRTCRIGLERLEQVYKDWNRQLPKHYKFQVRVPYSTTVNIRTVLFQEIKDWLKGKQQLRNTFITVHLRYEKNSTIEDLCTTYRKFARSNCASTPATTVAYTANAL